MELFNDHFQNFKRYNFPKAQLLVADIPYSLGTNAYGSSPAWYIGGDNKNGESELAGKQFFDTDKNFRVPEFMHFASKMLRPEPKAKGQAPCMIVFCSFEQQMPLIEEAKRYGFKNYINLVFRKPTSPQVLKANMRVVGNAEYALGPDPRKVDTSGVSYAALVSVAEFSASKTSGAERLHQECRRRVL